MLKQTGLFLKNDYSSIVSLKVKNFNNRLKVTKCQLKVTKFWVKGQKTVTTKF